VKPNPHRRTIRQRFGSGVEYVSVKLGFGSNAVAIENQQPKAVQQDQHETKERK